jgi:hypothetical protein
MNINSRDQGDFNIHLPGNSFPSQESIAKSLKGEDVPSDKETRLAELSNELNSLTAVSRPKSREVVSALMNIAEHLGVDNLMGPEAPLLGASTTSGKLREGFQAAQTAMQAEIFSR